MQPRTQSQGTHSHQRPALETFVAAKPARTESRCNSADNFVQGNPFAWNLTMKRSAQLSNRIPAQTPSAGPYPRDIQLRERYFSHLYLVFKLPTAVAVACRDRSGFTVGSVKPSWKNAGSVGPQKKLEKKKINTLTRLSKD